ncbi:hypothetical protein M0R72_09000 [Candidatus Pacearchaeota archaeon]|jgi:hypothetical protein|nr:hypothetical protein [Candidatus Pacearchaeota archaeon]
MEQHTRQRTVQALNRAGLDAISVENPAYPGTPDVNYVGGWVELKWIADWPKRAATPVKINHFTPQQRVWAIRRSMADRHGIWLMLQVGKTGEWLLFKGEDVGEIGKTLTRDELYDLAVGIESGPEKFIPLLRRRYVC